MNIGRLLFATFMVAFPSISIASSKIIDVKVYFDSRYSTPQYSSATEFALSYIDLGQAAMLQDSMSSLLPKEQAEATKFMQDLMNTNQGKKQINEIVNATKDIADSYVVGVKEIPAVVVNGSYVIYGTTDVFRAVSIFNQIETRD